MMKPSEARKLAKARIAAWRAQSLQEFHEKEERLFEEAKPAFKYYSWENRAKFRAHLKKSLEAFFALNPDSTTWQGNFSELFKLLSTLDMPTDGLYRFAAELPLATDFFPCKIIDETWIITKSI